MTLAAYYQDDAVTLYHGDCREVDAWLTADVLVTDPPYGMRYKSRTDAVVLGDTSTEVRDTALRLWADRPALIFGTWKVARPRSCRQVLIWDKAGGSGFGSTTSPWGNSHEEIYVCGPWQPPKAGGRAREGGNPQIGHSVQRFPVLNPAHADRPEHPTPKPVSLMELLIAKCPPGVIADPFAGSGPTLVAARNLGRRAIGVEVEERYCETIAKRLAQGAFDFGVA